MASPLVFVLTGYGINCEEETAFAFTKAGARAEVIHVNDLIENRARLNECQIFVFPGGFSYGDDTGSGKALANRIKNNLIDDIKTFLERNTLTLGICNGFQVMANLGVVPAFSGYLRSAEVALDYNESTRYQCRWVDLAVNASSPCVFTRGIKTLHVPVAHGEGRFFAKTDVLDKIEGANLAPMSYAKPDMSPALGEFPYNPNGSERDICSVCDSTGRIMGMMPHPERAIFFTQRDDWTLVREGLKREGKEQPELADGFMIFKNAVDYFK
jgi:phosphoribosylformylglycinamidine synthase